MTESSIKKVFITSGRINRFGTKLVIAGIGALFLTTGISAIHKYLTGQATSLDPILGEYPILVWVPISMCVIGAILMFIIRRRSIQGSFQIKSDSLTFEYEQETKKIDIKDVDEIQIEYHHLVDDSEEVSLEVKFYSDREYVYLTDKSKWELIENEMLNFQENGIRVMVEK